MSSYYEDRKKARIDRYKDLAENADKKSSNLSEQSSKMASVIPFGQPILVGHHSEKRDRNYREKIWNKMGSSVEESKKAEYYREKAIAAENNTSISSDDPEAVKLLKEKIETLEERSKKMKTMNAAWRAYAKTGDSGKLEALGLDSEKIKKLEEQIEKAYSFNKQPYPSYELTNLSAKIRSAKERLAGLQREESIRPCENLKTEWVGVEVVENVDLNRIQLLFPGKPSSDIRACLKSNGFRWSPYNKAWQRQLNSNGRAAVRSVLPVIEAAAKEQEN